MVDFRDILVILGHWLTCNHAPYIAVQQTQVWRARRAYVWGNVIIEIVMHPFSGQCSLVGRYIVFLCSCSLSKDSQLSLTPPYSNQHWEKKWGDLIFPLLLITPRTITIAGNFVCMTTGLSLRFLHNHQSFPCGPFGPKQFFSWEKTQNIPDSWCFKLLSKYFVWIRQLSLVVGDINWPLCITLDLCQRFLCAVLLIVLYAVWLH